MNSLSTQGYFVKRLRDAGFVVIKLFSDFASEDDRKWTIMVAPGKQSVQITCYKRLNSENDIFFKIEDGNRIWKNNYFLNTSSVNVVINELVENKISKVDETDEKYRKNNGEAS